MDRSQKYRSAKSRKKHFREEYGHREPQRKKGPQRIYLLDRSLGIYALKTNNEIPVLGNREK
jgi:hypothetical protein